MEAPQRVRIADSLLVVIDVQDRLAASMTARPAVEASCRLLVGASTVLGVPVIATRQYPAGLGDIVAGLADAQWSTVVDKVTFDCMAEPAFERALALAGRSSIVLAGMETHICVAQTALSLIETGHAVHVVADAVCSRRALDHETALARLRAAGAHVTTTEAVVYEWLERAGTPTFKAVLELVKEREGAL